MSDITPTISMKVRSSETTGKDKVQEGTGSQLALVPGCLPHLQPRVEVPVQPLHNKQYRNAGATTIVVINDRTVKIH